MKARRADKSKQTVLLATHVGSFSTITVNLAVQLAASVDTRLQGLFIEDEDLLQVSGLPCTREITLTTARERPTNVEQMRRSLRSAAEQFRRVLEQEAGALEIGWSFDYVQGRVRDLGRHPELSATYTVIGQSERQRVAARPDGARRKILVIADRAQHLRHALKVVLDRFVDERLEVTLIGDSAMQKLRQTIDRVARKKAMDITLKEVQPGEVSDLLMRQGPSFSCAILSQHETPETLSKLLQQLRCPVVLVA